MKKQRGVFEKVPGSGIWWIQYFGADGKRHREKIGAKSAAMRVVEMRRAARTEGRKLPKPRARKLLFREIAPAVLAYKTDRADYSNRVSRMQYLIDAFGDCAAEDMTPEQIESWLESARDQRSKTPKPLSLATKNRYIALLKLTFRLAERAKRISFNPARSVRQEKENNARIRWLRDEEEIALRAVIEREYAPYMPQFEIALHTGMRRSEQYERLSWENLDFVNNLIEIPKTKHGERRYLPMNSRVRLLLSMLKESSGPVFSDPGPHWFNTAVKHAGIKDFSWHCLRHTFISRLVMAGVDLRTVQELAGHKTIQMTCRYAHLSPKHQQAAIEKLVSSATTTATDQIGEVKTECATVN